MPSQDKVYVLDIFNAARLVQTFTIEMDEASFEQNVMRQSAVMYQLEVMGEATKRLSKKFRAAHPEIPWRKIAGMRDVLIHAYDHVDVNEVWFVIEFSIPELIEKLEVILDLE